MLGSGLDRRNGLVLIVDDDVSMRLLLRTSIERGGFSVEEAADGRQAIELFDLSKPDAVLLDVVMPGLDGFETCAALRQRPGGVHVPILMVTGVDDVESIGKAYEAGATDFASKPINWLILTERVRYMLRASRAAEDLRRSREILEQAQHIARLGSWEWDPLHSLFICSQETFRICGFNSSPGPNGLDCLFELLHPEDRVPVREAIEEAIQEGKSSRMDHRIVTQDGNQVMVCHQIRVMGGEEEPPYRVTGTIQDISERKQTEQLEIDRNKVLQMVIGSEPLHDILTGLARLVENQRARTLCVIAILRDDQLQLAAAPSLPVGLRSSFEGQPVGIEGSPSAMAAYLGHGITANDLHAKNPFGVEFKDRALREDVQACLSIPIFSGKGQVLGTVTLLHREPYVYTSSDHELIEMAAKLAAVSIEQRNLHERLAHQAHHDALTGLPNRLLAGDRLEGALMRCDRHNEKTALIYIDLDRFKHVNDSLGHQVGDLLLRQVAERLKGCTRKSDTLARMGGDEFLVVMHRVMQAEDVSRAAERILNALVTPFTIDGRLLHIGASMGISVFPEHGHDAVSLQRNADIAMYSAKNEGGNRYRYYCHEMNALVIERLQIENDLRKALERNEFELFFQPQFQLSSREVYGVEALLRWNHPELGRIPPARFIPIAEETGLIVPIGSWVLRRACEQNMQWQRAGYSPFRVAVNVSAVQVGQPGFVDEVAETIEEFGLDPQWLELEITESVLMKDMKMVAGMLDKIRNLGVSVAIDDFGNGYSSLSYLQKLPVDCLKIDQSFIREIEQLGELSSRSRTLIRTFVNLAASLGVRLLAEGVESDEQFRFLSDIGCELGQGFLLGIPMQACDIESLCSRGWDLQGRETGD
jgi:diguanylate cyclase (GGDEF)-like protein